MFNNIKLYCQAPDDNFGPSNDPTFFKSNYPMLSHVPSLCGETLNYPIVHECILGQFKSCNSQHYFSSSLSNRPMPQSSANLLLIFFKFWFNGSIRTLTCQGDFLKHLCWMILLVTFLSTSKFNILGKHQLIFSHVN